ncbi:MAG: hypothetical protein AAGB06_04865, partial [Verrucomicrobiota bacterium]
LTTAAPFLLPRAVMARFGDYSLWAIVMKVVPGADGIRAVFRLNTILYVIALASVAKYLSVLIDRKFNIGFRILTVLLCLLLFAENWMIEKHFRLQLQSEEWVMKGIDLPPYPIDAFWGYRSIDPNTSILPKELLSLEGHMIALRLAQTLGVPTINGNSGMLPDGWHLKEIAFYDEPWDEPLKAWLGKHDRSEVGSIGIIDLDTGEWNEDPLNY